MYHPRRYAMKLYTDRKLEMPVDRRVVKHVLHDVSLQLRAFQVLHQLRLRKPSRDDSIRNAVAPERSWLELERIVGRRTIPILRIDCGCVIPALAFFERIDPRCLRLRHIRRIRLYLGGRSLNRNVLPRKPDVRNLGRRHLRHEKNGPHYGGGYDGC